MLSRLGRIIPEGLNGGHSIKASAGIPSRRIWRLKAEPFPPRRQAMLSVQYSMRAGAKNAFRRRWSGAKAGKALRAGGLVGKLSGGCRRRRPPAIPAQCLLAGMGDRRMIPPQGAGRGQAKTARKGCRLGLGGDLE